jgi:uncharacterized membrane protein
MEVDKNEQNILERAIDEWQQTGQLTPEQATALKHSLEPKRNDRQQIAQYFFFIALFCTLLAFGAIFLNEKLLEKIKLYFSWNDLAIASITAVLSALWFWYVGKKRRRLSAVTYEIYMVLGGLSVLTSLIYCCKQAGSTTTYTTFLLLSFFILGILSAILRSKALWIGAIAAIIGWFGEYSVYQSSDNLFLCMNYPLRYTALGLVILALAFVQARIKPIAFVYRITYVTGLVLLFCGLWGISIFGNYNTLVGWQQVRQIHVLAYSIIFAAASVMSFLLGIKYEDETARDFGVLFLLINLYTRYFEYFWDSMNKGIFFLILAITFGLVGRWLERNNRKRRKTGIAN